MRQHARRALAIVMCVLQCTCVVCWITSTFIPMFRLVTEDDCCFTALGELKTCSKFAFKRFDAEAFGCATRQNYLLASMVFAALGGALALAGLGYGISLFCSEPFHTICAVVTFVSIFVIDLASWALVVGARWTPMCASKQAWGESYHYGPAFALLVVPCCLQAVALVLLFLFKRIKIHTTDAWRYLE